MSMRRIEDALRDYGRITGKADEAFAELANIRKAAKHFREDGFLSWGDAEWVAHNEALAVLDAIAKEAL